MIAYGESRRLDSGVKLDQVAYSLKKDGDLAFCKKKSRAIKVDGEAFRWVFQEDQGCNAVTVQIATGKGAKLSVQFAWHARDTNQCGVLEWYEIITPKLVAGAIRRAKNNCWQPEISGPPFNLRIESNEQVVFVTT